MKRKNIILLLTGAFIFQSLFNLYGKETCKEENSLSCILKNIDESLTKLGNKKIAVIIQYEGDLSEEAYEFKNALMKGLTSSGQFEVIDSLFLSIKSRNDLNIDNAKKWYETINLGSIFLGELSRAELDKIKLDWRLINLKDLTIITKDVLIITTPQSPIVDLKNKIEEIKLKNLDNKEETIIKTIAEFCKPNPEIKYTITYFPCSIAESICKKLNLKDGFYKIYYQDEFVLTVDKNGNILESYYYGKKNTVRKDINLEEFLKQRIHSN